MAKSIMIQGTMSNVGKSLLTAALCRIFKQDGYSCAPFKSQNMALNSFVTCEGLEMGRAQAMQAQAAGIEPSVIMNPILLKPTGDISSQVILNGKAVGNMSAAEYFKRRKDYIPIIESAYHKLNNQYDIVVIEGAGSPAELNLKTDDIVNMGIAKLESAPVLLVGDIDRGGVFAQLLGTLDLLEPNERELVKALVVNKFRGDRSFFKEGVEILEERGRIPVVGVVPYINCDIEDEDSLSEKLENTKQGTIDIAVIRLPRISNFTDFDAFSQFAGVSVRYVNSAKDLKDPDLIIIPGTKSTISDMKFLSESGLEAAVKKLAAKETPIFGICGGYQLLGKVISDPECTEGGGTISGMGLLDVKTVFSAEKTLTQTKGKFGKTEGFFSCFSGIEFEGYEIHHGITENSGRPLVILDNGRTDGAALGNVCGSYVHGIFDSKDVCESIIRALYKRKGLEYNGTALDRAEYKQREFDLLAAAVRENLDMKLIYRIIEEGV